MAAKHCRNNENMSRQKINRNHEETLYLCCDIQIPCRDTMKGRVKKECHDIAKIVATQVDQSSLGVCYDNGFYVATNHIEISSTRQVKIVAIRKTLSRQLSDSVN